MLFKRIEEPSKIKEYYKDTAVAEEYIKIRFNEPIFKVEHKRQVEILNYIIKKYNCQKILEIAPGPARLTKDIIAKEGVAMDSSEAMLEVAKRILSKTNKKWSFVKGDAFDLKFKKNSFDMVLNFRFLFHFKEKKRAEFYEQLRTVLDNKGIFVFEALNVKKVKFVRKVVGEHKYHIYSKMFDKKKLTKELDKNGFKVLKMLPHISHFWTEMLVSRVFSCIGLQKTAEKIITLMENVDSKNPYEWVVLCQKK